MQRGIAAAQESGLPLYFLHVLDFGRLLQAPREQLDALSREMMEQGEFIILTAQTRAQQQGLRAHGLVRSGDIREQIYAMCLELEVDHLLIGQPVAQGQGDEFEPPMLEELKQRIERETQTHFTFCASDTPGNNTST